MRSVFLAAAITSLSLPAAAAQESESPTGPAGGKIIFQQICAPCHGKDAKGTGPVAKSLKTPPADLTGIAARRGGSFPAKTIEAFIDGRTDIAAHGSREMPVWGDSLAQAVNDKDTREGRIGRAIQMLVQYLETVQKK
jgi:mono/diheme cytochrome c family protein